MYGRCRITTPIRLVLMVGLAVLTLSACGDDAKVTSDFTERMAAADQERSKVLDRLSSIKQDCMAGAVPRGICDTARTWYTDHVMAEYNSWLTAIEADVTESKSLENIANYDDRVKLAFDNAESYNRWIDTVRGLRSDPQTGGANAAPRPGEVVEALPDIAEAGVTIWKEYEAGKDAHVDKVKDALEEQKFPPYDNS
jgi:hypothetical protein